MKTFDDLLAQMKKEGLTEKLDSYVVKLMQLCYQAGYNEGFDKVIGIAVKMEDACKPENLGPWLERKDEKR